MIPWTFIDSAAVPGGGELRLMRRGSEFSIMAGSNELMNSRVSGSEEALARLSFERIRDRERPSVLIGGLGMGFTLRAALATGLDAQIVVAELVPAVVSWARGPLATVFGDSLDDPRVTVRTSDVGALIRSSERGSYDAILLDVDNGPAGLSRKENNDLYSESGLRAAYEALRRGGVLAVWSASPEARFTRRLRETGFAVEELKARAHRSRGARHLIWMATRS